MGDRLVHAGDVYESVVVTGDWNNVALTLGDTGIRLPLRRKQFPPRERRRGPVAGAPPCELDLLVPEAGNLPLIGRKDLFAELQAWLDDKADISVHALIGPAGTGKTRLALEFCGAIDSDPSGKDKWIAGFLSPGDLGAVVETLATHSFEWERRTLLIIDYAAQSYQTLARWLDRLADKELDTKLRILLLDREAPEAFGWWHELTALGPPGRRELFHALRPRQLPDLSDLEERRELLIAALEAAHRMRPGASASISIPAAAEDPDFDGRLTEPQFGNPLNLVMAGVIAVDRGPQGALALRRLDAARQIARRELRRLSDLAHSRQIGDGDMRHAVAFNGLAGGIPVADLRKIVGDELAVSRRSTDHLDAVLTLLQQELPPRTEAAQQSRVATIQPDLIGEAVIIEAFTGEPAREAEAAEVVRRAYELDRDAAAHALVRLVQDFGYSLEDPDATDDEKATGHRVMGWLLNLTREIKSPEEAVPLALAIPWQTTILRELVVELTQRIAIFFSREAERSKDLIAARNAGGWFNNLALRLKDLGRREEALAAAEVSVRLRGALAEMLPEAAVPDLAQSLNTLAKRSRPARKSSDGCGRNSARRGGLGPRIAPACWRSKPSSRLCQVYVFGTRKGCRLGKDSGLIQTSIPARSPAVMHGIRHAGRGNGHDHEGTDGLHDSPLERDGFEPSVPRCDTSSGWCVKRATGAGWAPAFLDPDVRETATCSRIALATPLEPGYRALVPPPGFI